MEMSEQPLLVGVYTEETVPHHVSRLHDTETAQLRQTVVPCSIVAIYRLTDLMLSDR